MEVLLILLSCFMIFPGCVMLNRGNHEDAVMNHRYGFTREVHQKYRHNADRLLKLIDQVYRHLPLGTLINNKIFVVHGGISETTDLNLIASVRRSKVRSIDEVVRLNIEKFSFSTFPFCVHRLNHPTTSTSRPNGSKSLTFSGAIRCLETLRVQRPINAELANASGEQKSFNTFQKVL